MKTTARQWLTFLLTLAMGTSAALTADITLKVGDSAPKLQTGKWIQGEPVKQFAKGKAYLVEFWATWCGPCHDSIPHVNELQQKYKDKGFIVIGQDCWEQDENQVAPFVKKMGDKMTFRVALDEKEGDSGKMADTWMAAAGRGGIPNAFLVDTAGKIAWIGHPMELETEVIDAVLKGTFDLKKAAADHDKKLKTETAFNTAWGELQQLMSRKKWDEAETKLAETEKMAAEDKRDGIGMTRFSILLGKEDYTQAYKVAKQLSDSDLDNARLQHAIASRILRDPDLKTRDLPLAEKAASRASEATQGKEPVMLDHLARAQFMNGKKDEAVKTEQKAVDLAEGNAKTNMQSSLDSYKKGEMPK